MSRTGIKHWYQRVISDGVEDMVSADHSAANDLDTHLHTNTHSHMHDIMRWEPQPRVRGSWRKMGQNRKGEIF